MIQPADLVIPVAVIVVCVIGGFAFAWWRDVRAAGAVNRVTRGGGLTVPVLVSVAGHDRRAYAVVDDGDLQVVGPRTRLHLPGRAYTNARQRRQHVDDELLEFATQRGFVDAAGTRYLVGAFEEWEPALTAALAQPPRRASRPRLLAAAMPRLPLALLALACLALLVFQGIWAAGHDVGARMERVIGEEGLESCAVRWTDGGEPRYAEVDCYPPFPRPGSTITVHALAFPFEGAALDDEATYEGLTLLPGVTALVAAAVVVGQVTSRLRRPAVRLAAQPARALELSVAEPVRVGTDEPLAPQLDALARVEGWDHGAGTAPPPTRYQRHLVAVRSVRWWPVPVLAGLAILLEDVPDALRYGLGAAGAALLLWALVSVASTWRTLAPAYVGPVTSEWDYRLLRMVDDTWFVLLVLGDRPHWLVSLADEAHPQVTGRCGVRGDLRDGAAVALRIDDEFWMTGGPVERVDEETLHDLHEEVRDRLRELGGTAR